MKQLASTVPAGGSTAFEAAFNLSGVGLRQAGVVIENDDADEAPFSFAVQGTGLSGDTIPPEVVVAAPSRVTGPFEATVTFSEPVLGFAPGDVALANGTAAAAFASQTGTTFVVEITPTEHGRMTIGVPSGGSDAAGNTNRAAVTVEANYIDEAYVHRRTGRVIANFMSRRADHITAKDPDLTGGSPRAAAARGAERHRSQASGTGANNRFAFATNLRRIAQAEALKKEAAIAALGAGAMGLGYGGLDSPAIVETGFDISVQGK